MATDWALVTQVIVYGFSAVFLVLAFLSISVSLSSKIIIALENKFNKTDS